MNQIVDVMTMIVVVTGILVLTRPGSQGPKLVDSIGGAFQGALATASGATPKGYTAAPHR